MRACIYARMYVCIYVDVKAFRRENPKRLKPLDQKRLEVSLPLPPVGENHSRWIVCGVKTHGTDQAYIT